MFYAIHYFLVFFPVDDHESKIFHIYFYVVKMDVKLFCAGVNFTQIPKAQKY